MNRFLAQATQPFASASTVKHGQGKRRLGANPAALTPVALLVGALLAIPSAAQAQAPSLPTGGKVVSGEARIGQSGAQMTIDQASAKAIVHWQGFDIGRGAKVQFNQPGANAVALNRVVAGNASRIDGQLSANGQVWLVNPNGVVFGKGSQVNVGGLVASTLDIANEDFNAGKQVFTRGAAQGGITNQGNITVADGGTLALLAASVKNEGTLNARLGNVVLAGGDKVTLQAGVDGKLQVAVDPATVRTLIENGQLITANGGQVVMTSSAADALSASVVSNTGTVQARTLENKGGRILLQADMQHGEVVHRGLLDAGAPDGGNGGFVETSAQKVQLRDGRKVTTRAASGQAGTWLIHSEDARIGYSGIYGTQLSRDLDEGNVTISAAAVTDLDTHPSWSDLRVDGDITWSANTLTLNSTRNINVNAVMTAKGTARLEMNYGGYSAADPKAAPGQGSLTFEVTGHGGRVDFKDIRDQSLPANQRLKINGDRYTILTALGDQGSTTGLDLQGMRGNLSGKYALGADIDARATEKWSKGAGFAPVGDEKQAFGGVFEGLGHEISELNIKRPDQSHVGLFGSAMNATLRNVTLMSSSVEGYSLVGGLVGDNRASGAVAAMHNVINVGDVRGKEKVGGLVGRNWAQDGGEIQMSQSKQTARILGGGNAFGGLVGQIRADGGGTVSVSKSSAHGYMEGNNAVGGLAGLISAGDGGTVLVSDFLSKALVKGNEWVGGLVGGATAYGGKIEISDAKVLNWVRGHKGIGGMMGATLAAQDGTVGISKSFVGYLRIDSESNNHSGSLMGVQFALGGDVKISDVEVLEPGKLIGTEFGFNDRRLGKLDKGLAAGLYAMEIAPLKIRD